MNNNYKISLLVGGQRKGNCLDNSVKENFFGLLKSELLYLQTFDSLFHFIQVLNEYIDFIITEELMAN